MRRFRSKLLALQMRVIKIPTDHEPSEPRTPDRRLWKVSKPSELWCRLAHDRLFMRSMAHSGACVCAHFLLTATLMMMSHIDGRGAEQKSLAERLGYKDTDKLLIVNGDDVGMCHAANLATIESLE